MVFREPPVVEPAPEGSEYVRWVQSSLNQIMGLRLPVDGIMGPETRSAIRSFQARHGLSVDGIVGPETERAIMTARTGQPPGPEGPPPPEPGVSQPPGPGDSQPSEPSDSQPPGPEDSQPLEPGEFAAFGTYEAWEGEVSRRSPEYVRWVQQSLNQIMRLRLAADGVLRPQTRSAVRSFQQRQGLTADGIVGPAPNKR
jgi:peptidoglycan hydrolase-like protein with peptidoglycan-binding domain